jgi:hypothetical protein
MSFNLLRFGTQIVKKDKKVNLEEKFSNDSKDSKDLNDSIIPTSFPNCIKLKKQINLYKKQVKLLEKQEISEKLKMKKFEILLEKLKIAKEALNEKLNLNSPQIDEVDPLCSFEEIQK